MKRFASLALAGILSLAVAAPTFAASTSGTTTEEVSVGTTITMTVPTSPLVYSGSGSVKSADATVSDLNTNNPNGLTVKLWVNDQQAGKIRPNSRSLSAVTVPGTGPWHGSPANANPFSTGGIGEPVTLASYDNNSPAVGTISFTSRVDTTSYAPGSFTGELNFVASTNP